MWFPPTCSISITWGLIRDAESQAPTWTGSETLRGGQQLSPWEGAEGRLSGRSTAQNHPGPLLTPRLVSFWGMFTENQPGARPAPSLGAGREQTSLEAVGKAANSHPEP